MRASIIYLSMIALCFNISTTNCNLFPMFLGGNKGNTSFTALDANLDMNVLAAGGYTNDNELFNRGNTFSTNVSIIGVYNISTIQILWMKSDLSKDTFITNSIRLSPNG